MCVAPLLAREAQSLDTIMLGQLATLRNALPPLVDHVARLCDDAPPIERAELVRTMVEDIEQLAAGAAAARERERADLRQSLATLRTHIADRMRGGTVP